MTERGCFNYRWPFNEYCLHLEHLSSEDINTPQNPSYCFCPADCGNAREGGNKIVSHPIGSYSILSFIKEGILYQVLRIAPRVPVASGILAKKAKLIIMVEPPMRLQSFRHLQQEDSEKYQVGLGACRNREHTKNKEACFSPLESRTTKRHEDSPISDMHWQAKLFRIKKGDHRPEVIQLETAKDKKDHVFKTNDGFDSLPSFQTKQDLEVNTAHVFVAMFRLFHPGRDDPIKPDLPLSHSSISKFVQQGEDDAPGTASMWQSIFNDRQDRMNYVPELCEGNIIGRCLEKILRVDLVPATIWLPQLPKERSNSATKEDARHESHFTIVSNMFLKANVEMKTVFWKVRFLVKVDQLLSKRVVDKGGSHIKEFRTPADYNKRMLQSKSSAACYSGSDQEIITAEATVRRIRYVVGEIMAYIMRALVRPTHHPTVLSPEFRLGDPGHFYAMITLFYVVQHYPQAQWRWDLELKDASIGTLGSLGWRLPGRQENVMAYGRHSTTRVKFSLLEWLHHESVLGLQKKFQSPELTPDQWRVSEQKIKELRNFTKTELVRRIASAEPYRSDDEIADRLVFLAEELLGPNHETAKQLAGRVIKRVAEREFTHEIDLCRSSRVKEGTDDGPWELHALCHHSRLVVASRKLSSASEAEREEAEMEVEHYRKKFHPFLTSEASLTPCWERNNLSARRGFLRSEATSVLASTLIDVFLQHHHPSIMINGTGTSNVQQPPGKLATASDLEQYVNYLSFRPPVKYHPVEFFNSLDDTPEMYSNDCIDKREIYFPAGIRKALSNQEPPPGEIKMSGDHTIDSYKFLKELKEVMRTNSETTNILREILVRGAKFENLPKRPSETILDLQTAEASRLLFESEMTIIDLKTPDAKDGTFRPAPARYKDIISVISDSLVDQEVCHRFLLARAAYKLPAGLLRLFVHVLHPEMIECFNNHHHRLPRFGRLMRQETMVVHITLRSWSLQPEKKDPGASTSPAGEEEEPGPPTGRGLGPFRRPTALAVAASVRGWAHRRGRGHNAESSREHLATGRDDKGYEEGKIEIPPNLLGVLAGKGPKPMELKVSSIGMSTTEFGDFSKCSIITDLIALKEIQQLGPQAQKIWDGFTHQPQTGRFLVFSLVLGHITRGMVRDYNQIIDDFLKETQLEKKMPSYIEDPQRLQQRDADAELRLSLWSLEALNKLSNTVSTSVRIISDAMAEITTEVSKGPGKRSPELEAACRKYLEGLEKSFSDLTAIQTRLGRKVELSTRYSSALQAVLALRASRDSYIQNNTIQKLTYLTIGCLPIGLTAALFAVPKEQLVIPEGTGATWFIITVLISFAVIFFIAYYLDSLLRFLRKLPEKIGAKLKRAKPEASPPPGTISPV